MKNQAFLLIFFSLFMLNSGFNQSQHCLDFTGGYDRLWFPTPISGEDDFTLEAWFKSDNNTGSYLARLFTWWGDGTRFEVGDRNGKLQIFEYDGNSHWVDTDVNIIDGNWHHVAITRENNVFNVYVDGELKNTHTRVLLMNNNLSVGHWNSTLIQLSQWIGRIDEIRLWNIVRTQSDIQSTMNSELSGNEPGLAVYLDFNQGIASGDNIGLSTAIDQTGNGFDGTLLDFALTGDISNWVCSGAMDAICDDCPNPEQVCLDFDGYEDYIQVMNSPIQGEVDFTVECWFFMEDYDGDTGCGGNMERIIGAGGDRYEIGVCDEQMAVVVSSGSAVTLNSVENHIWYHVAGTREGNQFHFYLDGELIWSTNTPTELSNNFRVGKWPGAGAFNQVWPGKLDDFKVWNYARSQDEILSAKDCELIGTEDGLTLYYNFNEGIPYEDNTNITVVPDLTQNGYDGIFNGFDKAGNESNYACSNPLNLACAPAPEVIFSSDNSQGCAPHIIQFYDETNGEVDSWNWSFPGGTPSSSTEQNPIVVYYDPGIFDVTLKVMHSSYGTSTSTFENYVLVEVSIFAAFDFVVNSNEVTFTNNSQNASNLEWNFGDNSPLSNEENPVHEYGQPGVYLVTLIVSNEFCGSAISQNVAVLSTGEESIMNDKKVKIYPNPAVDVLHIESDNAIKAVQIFNLLGQEVLKKDNLGNIGSIYLSRIPSGIYTIKMISDDDQFWVTEFVKR